MAAEEIGSLEDGLAAQLPDGVMQAHGVALRQQAGHWHLQGEGDATALLNALARVLRAHIGTQLGAARGAAFYQNTSSEQRSWQFEG